MRRRAARAREREGGGGGARRRNDAAFRAALLAWFSKNARPLPWRGRSDPYSVWVSEVMLQQTQVASVMPFYRRFLQAFPTVRHLARAPYEDVMKLWSGLGYYRRARLLHEAARKIVTDFAGRFPESYPEARSLPGVGDYTARAILSIVYHQPLPVLDGNVARVMARINARSGNLHDPRFRRTVGHRLDALISRRSPGAFNQAMMELGQTICTSQLPRCAACPVGHWCKARRQGRQADYPSPRPRRANELRHLAAAVIRKDGKLALVRGLGEKLLADVWNFPSAFGDSESHAAQRLRRKLAALAEGVVLPKQTMGSLRHSITYRSIHVSLYAAELRTIPARDSFRWLTKREFAQEAVSQLARKIAAVI